MTPVQCEMAEATKSLIDSIHLARFDEIKLALIWLRAVFIATYGLIIVATSAVHALTKLNTLDVIQINHRSKGGAKVANGMK